MKVIAFLIACLSFGSTTARPIDLGENSINTIKPTQSLFKSLIVSENPAGTLAKRSDVIEPQVDWKTDAETTKFRTGPSERTDFWMHNACDVLRRHGCRKGQVRMRRVASSLNPHVPGAYYAEVSSSDLKPKYGGFKKLHVWPNGTFDPAPPTRLDRLERWWDENRPGCGIPLIRPLPMAEPLALAVPLPVPFPFPQAGLARNTRRC